MLRRPPTRRPLGETEDDAPEPVNPWDAVNRLKVDRAAAVAEGAADLAAELQLKIDEISASAEG